MKVQIQTFPELRVAAIRHGGPYPGISEAFAKLGGIAGREGWYRPGAQMLAVYHDDPETTPAAELRSDACLSVDAETVLPAGVYELFLPAGEYATTEHLGPYTMLGDTWQQLLKRWLPTSGYRMGKGYTFEVYLNNPMDTAPEKLRTELRVPVVKS